MVSALSFLGQGVTHVFGKFDVVAVPNHLFSGPTSLVLSNDVTIASNGDGSWRSGDVDEPADGAWIDGVVVAVDASVVVPGQAYPVHQSDDRIRRRRGTMLS